MLTNYKVNLSLLWFMGIVVLTVLYVFLNLASYFLAPAATLNVKYYNPICQQATVIVKRTKMFQHVLSQKEYFLQPDKNNLTLPIIPLDKNIEIHLCPGTTINDITFQLNNESISISMQDNQHIKIFSHNEKLVIQINNTIDYLKHFYRYKFSFFNRLPAIIFLITFLYVITAVFSFKFWHLIIEGLTLAILLCYIVWWGSIRELFPSAPIGHSEIIAAAQFEGFSLCADLFIFLSLIGLISLVTYIVLHTSQKIS